MQENFTARFEKLTHLTNEQLTKIVDFRGMFQLPAVVYLNFVIHHSIHHRGQLSMYLRPMGAKVACDVRRELRFGRGAQIR